MIDIILNYLKDNILSLIIIFLNIFIIGILVYFNFFEEEPILEEPIEEVISVIETEPIEEEASLLVDVKGAVKKPGVYEVTNDTIVNDCIKLAGGLKSDADTNTINLSKKVVNEMVIYIPEKEEFKESPPLNDAVIDNTPIIGTGTEENNPSSDKKININTATLSELQELDGIGESKAQSIIDYRNEVGLFKDINELMNVSGIGETVFAKIKDNITI